MQYSWHRKISSVYLKLLDVVRRHVQADADGDEDEPDDEEGREDSARGEDGLPRGEPLLLKGGVFGLLVPQSPATGSRHGDVTVLVFGAVTGRHHNFGSVIYPADLSKLTGLASRRQLFLKDAGLKRRRH